LIDMEPAGPSPPSSDCRQWQYRCPVCGTRRVCTTAEVLQHVDTQMSECCGQFMGLSPLPPDDQPT
jgi:hypothetical protein